MCLISTDKAVEPKTHPKLIESVYAVDDCEVFSGPSTDFYPTGVVPEGKSLDVYYRTDDGWLGVRPPAGSFSWIAATDAYLLPGGRVVEIKNQDAISWIGSTVGSVGQFRWM